VNEKGKLSEHFNFVRGRRSVRLESDQPLRLGFCKVAR
jgi:hypothetical protein